MAQRKRRLTPKQLEALRLIGEGWEVIGPTQWAWRVLASPIVRNGRFVERRYLTVGEFNQLAALRRDGLVRPVGEFLRENLKITKRGRDVLAAEDRR